MFQWQKEIKEWLYLLTHFILLYLLLLLILIILAIRLFADILGIYHIPGCFSCPINLLVNSNLSLKNKEINCQAQLTNYKVTIVSGNNCHIDICVVTEPICLFRISVHSKVVEKEV